MGLVSRYDELCISGAYSEERVLSSETVAHLLPEDITCIKNVERALEIAYFDYKGVYETIPFIISTIRKAFYSKLDPVKTTMAA